MAHEFKNHEKIAALDAWATKLLERVQKVKDAINDADTMDRWTGVPDNIREVALQNALDEAEEFRRYAGNFIAPYDTIKVSRDRFEKAVEYAEEISDQVEKITDQIFQVPLWATGRIVAKLKLFHIRHWINTV